MTFMAQVKENFSLVQKLGSKVAVVWVPSRSIGGNLYRAEAIVLRENEYGDPAACGYGLDGLTKPQALKADAFLREMEEVFP